MEDGIFKERQGKELSFRFYSCYFFLPLTFPQQGPRQSQEGPRTDAHVQRGPGQGAQVGAPPISASSPTGAPTTTPTCASTSPTGAPTITPTCAPTSTPTGAPTTTPTCAPTGAPTTSTCTTPGGSQEASSPPKL